MATARIAAIPPSALTIYASSTQRSQRTGRRRRASRPPTPRRRSAPPRAAAQLRVRPSDRCRIGQTRALRTPVGKARYGGEFSALGWSEAQHRSQRRHPVIEPSRRRERRGGAAIWPRGTAARRGAQQDTGTAGHTGCRIRDPGLTSAPVRPSAVCATATRACDSGGLSGSCGGRSGSAHSGTRRPAVRSLRQVEFPRAPGVVPVARCGWSAVVVAMLWRGDGFDQ